jgi:hypothetical protein
MSRTTVPFICALAVLSCGDRAPPAEAPFAPVDSASVLRARGAADALGADLVSMLTGELQRGGPAAAIAVCADSAQVRTARHASEGILVRRVGTRVRNPRNAPDTVESAVLAVFADDIAAGHPVTDTGFTIRTANGRTVTRYLRAIKVQEMCLACHGPEDEIAAPVRRVLDERYPTDRATGYSVGELRGAISVTVVPPQQPD